MAKKIFIITATVHTDFKITKNDKSETIEVYGNSRVGLSEDFVFGVFDDENLARKAWTKFLQNQVVVNCEDMEDTEDLSNYPLESATLDEYSLNKPNSLKRNEKLEILVEESSICDLPYVPTERIKPEPRYSPYERPKR